jgi:hypothetical protein
MKKQKRFYFPFFFLVFLLAAIAYRQFVLSPEGTLGTQPEIKYQAKPEAKPPVKPSLDSASRAKPIRKIQSESRSKKVQTENTGEKLLSFLESKSQGSWKINEAETGVISSVTGGVIPGIGSDPGRALQLVRELAPLLGVEANQIESMPTLIESPRMIIQKFTQKVGGFTVFGSVISLGISKETKAVFLINTGLKGVDPFNDSPDLTASQAQKILEERFNESKAKFNLLNPKPVLWADAKPHELAWEFSMDTPAPHFDRRHILIGASTANILYNFSSLLH